MNKLPLPPQLAVIFELQVAASALIKFTSVICSRDFYIGTLSRRLSNTYVLIELNADNFQAKKIGKHYAKQ